MTENYDNLKIKYDNLVTKFNKREEQHKKQMQNLEAMVSDMQLQRNAVEKELFNYVKLYNEAENKYLKEKDIADLYINQEEDISKIDEDEYTYEYEDGIYNVYSFLKDMSIIQKKLCKMNDFISEVIINYEDENYYITLIYSALNDIFEYSGTCLFIDVENPEYKELADYFHGLSDLSYEFTKKLKEDKKFNNQLIKRHSLLSIEKYLKECEKNIKYLEIIALDEFVKAEFINYKKAEELYNYFYENQEKYFLFDIKKPTEENNDNK